MSHDWTAEDIGRLRDDWDAGYSTAEIGRRQGRSKNAVVGKAHQLDLPERPSPIKPRGSGKRENRRDRVKRVAGPTLAPLEALAVPQPIILPTAPTPAPLPPLKPTPCCFPLGDPGTKSFRFCEEPSEPKRPYCADHCRLAFVKLHDLRETAP